MLGTSQDHGANTHHQYDVSERIHIASELWFDVVRGWAQMLRCRPASCDQSEGGPKSSQGLPAYSDQPEVGQNNVTLVINQYVLLQNHQHRVFSMRS
jgi:hypothetical protein